MQLKDAFYKEEIRDGYLITKKEKKIWAVELDLLQKLLNVCNENDIKVYAFAGTLLGAVRHGGFIPWDDDIDVCMNRENFNKLLSISDRFFEYPYFLQTALNDKKYFLEYARLRNSETTGIIKWNNSPDYNNGIYIDIFVLDGFIEDEFKLKMQLFLRKFASKLINAYYADYENNSMIRKIIIFLLRRTIYKFLKYEDCVSFYNRVVSMYTEESVNLTLMTHSEYFIKRYICDKKSLEQSPIYLDFETLRIPVPKDFDNILKKCYGNYMEFPPVEKRGKWHENVITFDPEISYKEFFKKR